VGRESVAERLDRFFEIAMPVLAGELETIEFVDLRYSNGFSVSRREQPDNMIATNMESF
jgi:cell division septal protein FtsQ